MTRASKTNDLFQTGKLNTQQKRKMETHEDKCSAAKQKNPLESNPSKYITIPLASLLAGAQGNTLPYLHSFHS